MPATTTTTELIAKSVFTLLQVQAQRDLRIQAGAIRSTIDASDPVNYILTTEWNIIGGNDDDDDAQDTPVPSQIDDSPHMAPGTGHALTVNVGLGSDVNITNLATVLMSEASIGNDPERASVGFTVVNRLKMFGKTAVDQVWSAYGAQPGAQHRRNSSPWRASCSAMPASVSTSPRARRTSIRRDRCRRRVMRRVVSMSAADWNWSRRFR